MQCILIARLIAMEIIRTIAYLTGGGLGGYGIAKIAEAKSTPNDKPKRIIQGVLPVIEHENNAPAIFLATV